MKRNPFARRVVESRPATREGQPRVGWWHFELECGHALDVLGGLDYRPVGALVLACTLCRREARVEARMG